MPISYKDAGVDVTAGYKAVELMKKHAKSTFDENVIGGLGSFGGLYSLEKFDYKQPVLVSGTDGVGTKLKYAFLLNKHDTIGIDCVAMCANDVVCQGARPLFFLDYFAVGKLYPETAAEVVGGVSEGCRQAGCALIGGETAEMPGFYKDGEYDIAGFCVGIADKSKLITGANIKAGDQLIGLQSSGVHSNGYSLVRKLFGEDPCDLMQYFSAIDKPLAEELLTPTRIYVKTVLALLEKFELKGISHITGGGFIENIPRMLPAGHGAKININSYDRLPIFDLLALKSELNNDQLYNTFNMGIGMVICVDRRDAEAVRIMANELGEKAYVIGEVIKGEGIFL